MTDETVSDLLGDVLTDRRIINLQTLEQVIVLAVEIAREGRVGHKIGTMFVVGDSTTVPAHSKPLILDPLLPHPDSRKRISSPDMRETVQELAQLDGAFIVNDQEVVLSACHYINACSEGIDLPLGSRHMAAASITRETDAIAVVVSESSVVRVVDDGEIIAEIIPELWLLWRHGVHLTSPYLIQRRGQVTVASKHDWEE
jgi:DNA integrity scanning protein DisA with diadenylate cyclase activity